MSYIINNPNVELYVVEDNGRLVGYMEFLIDRIKNMNKILLIIFIKRVSKKRVIMNSLFVATNIILMHIIL